MNPPGALFFENLLHHIKNLDIIAALMAGMSAGVLTFNEFHPTLSNVYRNAEGFLVGSAASALMSIMLGVMLLFRYTTHPRTPHKDLVNRDEVKPNPDVPTRELLLGDLWLLCVPLVLVDWSIVSFLIGVMMWYGEKEGGWRSIALGAALTALLGLAMMISWKMYTDFYRPPGRNTIKQGDISFKDGGISSEQH